MNKQELAQRFSRLSAQQQKTFLQALATRQIDFALLPIVANDRQDRVALSYAQQRLWFLWKLDPHSSQYHIPVVLRLRGKLHRTALQASLDALVARHASLRTVFIEEQGQAFQHVLEPSPAELVYQDDEAAFACLDLDRQTRFLQARVQGETATPFDLQQGPLLRTRVLRLAQDDHLLIITLHHIVTDGWSMGILIDEFSRLYSAQVQGQPVQLEPLPIQYVDYAQWQRNWMEAGERERQLVYWQDKLGSEHPILELAIGKPRPPVQSFKGGFIARALPAALGKHLHRLARSQQVTVFQLLLASFQALLYRYSGQRDIRIGIPVANRTRVETRHLIGFFVNTQVLKAELDGQLPFSALLQQVRQTALEAQAHQDLPFEQLVDALQPERSLSHSPLFQVLFNHVQQLAQNAPQQQLPGLEVEGLGGSEITAKFDLVVGVSEGGDDLTLSLTYARDLFDADDIQSMQAHWQTLLDGIVETPDRTIADLVLESEPESVAEEASSQAWLPIHRLIELQAADYPERVALRYAGESLGFAELNAWANQLARYLRQQGITQESRVGLAFERGPQMIVALLAVLKAGAAYVPLDPEYPEERLSYIAEDSGLVLLLTHSSLEQVVSGLPRIDVDRRDRYSDMDKADLPDAADEHALAYLIYTSGSTGLPKGVAVERLALDKHCQAIADCYELQSQDRVLQFASLNFDAASEQILTPLARGASLLLADVKQWSEQELREALLREAVTVLNVPPSYLHASLPALAEVPLRLCILGAEALTLETLQALRDCLPATRLFNAYGPTETVITPLLWAADDQPLTARPGQRHAPIGRPVGPRQGYLLDQDLSRLPGQLRGELYIGGQGVARGYWQRPGLTAERFVPDAQGHGTRLYRTGDLVMRRADGDFECLGRLDHQVKLRGFRIELAEIEHQLHSLESVEEAAVALHEGLSGSILVAYLVPSAILREQWTAVPEHQQVWRDNLRAQLRESLPDYMLPSQWLILEVLPRLPNGKLDRQALPVPDLQALQTHYRAPRNALEQALAEIWQQVLKVERVGIQDNFFELGGDSIITIQIVSRARQQGIRLTPKDLFKYQSIQELSAVACYAEGLQIDQGVVSGDVLLTPIQRFFFEANIPSPHHWNQSLLLRPTRSLSAGVLQQALQDLARHHDTLRLVFPESEGACHGHYRTIDEEAIVLWQRQAENAEELVLLADQAQCSLNLEHGPLWRALLVDLQDGSQRLLLVVHHLLVDGVSWRILLEDLQTVYLQREQQQAVELPLKTSSLQDWSLALQRYAHSDVLMAELDYWQAQLSQVSGDIPCDHPDGGLQIRHVRSAQTLLSVEQTRQLLKQAPAAYRTQINDLLLTALARVLVRWTGESSVLLQLEGHGREDLFEQIDLTRTLGWFTSMYPLCLTPATDLASSIKRIKEQVRAVPQKGIGYGILEYLGPEDVRQTLRDLPQARVTFNYLGQFDDSFASEQDEGLFVPSGEAKGAGMDDDAPLGNWLSINGQVYGGQLSLSWSYSQAMYEPATIERLAEDYQQELERLIEHCLEARPSATPADFPLAKLSQGQLDRLPLAFEQVKDIYPLSPMQQGMLYQSLADQDGHAYISQVRLDVQGLDAERFIAAWQQVIDHHDVLRSGFIWQGIERPLQVVFRQVPLQVELLSMIASTQECDRQAEADLNQGFEWLRPPLLRLSLLRTADDHYHLIYTSHHILMDGWSSSRLFAEVMQAYAGQDEARSPYEYRDYIEWLERQPGERLQAFWQQRLQGFEQPCLLAQALPEKPKTGATGHRDHVHEWDEAATLRLSEFVRRQKITTNVLLQGAWLWLLQLVTGQARVACGSIVSGRPADLPGVETLLGLFINALPVIAEPRPDESVADWLQRLQQHNLELRDYEHTPLYDIQRWAGLAGEALYDTLLVFENYPVSEALQGPETQQAGPLFGNIRTQEYGGYPLTLIAAQGRTLKVRFNYDSAQFSLAQIEQLAGEFERLLVQMLAHPEQTLGQLDWQVEPPTPFAEKLLSQETNASLVDLIEQQVRLSPQALALSACDRQLTYAQLSRESNLLADLLLNRGVGPGCLVGVALSRIAALPVALLGILKTGAAYVPLDPEYPQERLAYMVADSGVQLVLTQEAHLASLQSLAVELLPWESIDWLSCSGAERRPVVYDASLACIIYTSGSTGRPKGVALPHGDLCRHLLAVQDYYQITPDDHILHFATINFDWGTEQWLLPLLSGARMTLRDDELWSVDKTAEVITTQGITVSYLPTQYAIQLAEYCRDHHKPLPLRCFNVAGEALSHEGYQLIQRYIQPQRLVNGYGPTETVITPLLWSVSTETGFDQPYTPIGQPIAPRQVALLDNNLTKIGVEQVGELYIGGDSLARGYQGKPGLTAERFVPNSLPDTLPGSRWYRSGDLVYRDHSGTFHYRERADHQVKIRGFRIEMQEIESLLLGQEDIREAVIFAVDGATGKQLVAYLVAKDEITDQQIWLYEVKERLARQLPAYMVPSRWVVLDEIPMTPNGKRDRLKLASLQSSTEYRENSSDRQAKTDLERCIVRLWQDLLKVDEVNLDSNFFDLGGHSLLVLRFISQLREQTGHDLGFHAFMQFNTLHGLVEALRGKMTARLSSPLVKLNTYQGSAIPLFCIHPGGGSAYCYYPLATALKERMPVYGIMCRTFCDKDWVDTSWSEMVEAYAGYIRTAQPQGSYKLLGWSLGGALAMDIAAYLERQGEKVEFLGMVDALVPRDFEYPELMEQAMNIQTDGEGDDTMVSMPLNLTVHQQSLLQQIGTLFPDLDTDRFVNDVPLLENDTVDTSAFIQWVANKRGLDPELLEHILNDFLCEREITVGYNILERLSALSRGFRYSAISGRTVFFWAGKSKGKILRDRLGEKIDKECSGGGGEVQIQTSDSKHVEIVFEGELFKRIVDLQ